MKTLKSIFGKIAFLIITVIISLNAFGCSSSSGHAHEFTNEVPDVKYLKSEATKTESAVYYKSCVCGEKGKGTFSYGDPIRILTPEEKADYAPTSMTLTLYDAENSVYGFTFNTKERSMRPVLWVEEGNSLTEGKTEYAFSTEEYTTYISATSPTQRKLYVSKVNVQLKANTTYTYEIYDKYADVGTEPIIFETADVKAESFTFAHVSDSQSSNNNGTLFGQVLAEVEKSCDFVVHTGDVVEWSKYENEWKNMLHTNIEHFSKMPIMAISGNHETTYQCGTNETYKHFNYKIPTQTSVDKGIFYSFVYGNVKFIMLNTNVLQNNRLTDEQMSWLINELQSSTLTWTVVAMHNPLYSVGKYGADPSRNDIARSLQIQLEGIFAEYGVDIVLQGHDHVVSRTYPINGDGQPQTETLKTVEDVSYSVDPNGVIYVMDGPASNQTREPYRIAEGFYSYAESSKQQSWAEISVNGNRMTVSVKYLSGGLVKIYHTWGIEKSV